MVNAETIAIAVGVSGLVLVLIGVIIFVVICIKRRNAVVSNRQANISYEDGWMKPVQMAPAVYNPTTRVSWGVMPQRYMSFADLPTAPVTPNYLAIAARPWPDLAEYRPQYQYTQSSIQYVTPDIPEYTPPAITGSEYNLQFTTPYGVYSQPYTPQSHLAVGAADAETVPIFSINKPDPLPGVMSWEEFKSKFESIPKVPGIVALEEKFPLPEIQKPPPIDTTVFNKFKEDFMKSFNDTKEKFQVFQEFTLPEAKIPTIPRAKLIDLNTQTELPQMQPLPIIKITKPKPLPPIVIPKLKPLAPIVITKPQPLQSIVIPKPQPLTLPNLQPAEELIQVIEETYQLPYPPQTQFIEATASEVPPTQVLKIPAMEEPETTYWMQPAPQIYYRMSYLANGNAVYH